MHLANLNELPKPSELRALLQSHAMLDAILSHELGESVYSFSEKWTANQSVGVVKNGQGDDLFFVFDSRGCFVKGWVHDIALSTDVESRKMIRDSVPANFAEHFSEPAFICDEATFFAWRENDASAWHSSISEKADDGSGYLLEYLRLDPESFQAWAEENYEVDVDLEEIEKIYKFEPLSGKTVQALNSSLTIGVIRHEASKIGYPIG